MGEKLNSAPYKLYNIMSLADVEPICIGHEGANMKSSIQVYAWDNKVAETTIEVITKVLLAKNDA
jgi:hypothetical protein